MDLPAWKKPKWIFLHNLGNLLRPSESLPSSRERLETVYPWQGFIAAQAPQYRQHALISDFPDLVNLTVQEEAALATNWIDDRPEVLKLQNLALASTAGPVMSSSPKNLTARPARY